MFQHACMHLHTLPGRALSEGRLCLPAQASVQKHKHAGLPNEHWSSDHIALAAEFQYRQPAPTPAP